MPVTGRVRPRPPADAHRAPGRGAVTLHRDSTVDEAQRSPRALLIVDMINALDFDGGAAMLEPALAAAERVLALKRAFASRGLPIIYANDNFGRWRSDFASVVRACAASGVRGRRLAERLAPADDDYFVLKPRHSAFYATPLELLLRQLGVEELCIVGLAGDNCVLFTAYDAYLREFRVFVPEDGVASPTAERNARALTQIRQALHGVTDPADAYIARLAAEPSDPRRIAQGAHRHG